MFTYEFMLHLAGVNEVTLDMADQLFAAGCDDASPGACGGRVHVDFAREANSLREAVESAITNIRAAGYEVARVTSDDYDALNSINAELIETSFANTLQRYERDVLAVREARQITGMAEGLLAQRQSTVKELVQTVNDLLRNVPIPIVLEEGPQQHVHVHRG